MKGARAIVIIVGIIALGYAAYWFFVVAPQRKHCLDIAAQTYSEQTTIYIDGLITSDQYKQANNTLQAAQTMCEQAYQ